HLPPEQGLPGDPIDKDSNPFALASYLLRCVNLLKTLMLSIIGPPDAHAPGAPRPDERSRVDEAADREGSPDPETTAEVLIDSLASRLRDGTLTLAAGLLQAVSIFETMLRDIEHSARTGSSVLTLLRAITRQARVQLGDLVTIDESL